LMVVVGIIGILAAIAIPSYQGYIRKSRRAAAQSCLVELGQWMERYYTTQMAYVDKDGNPPALPALSCTNDLASFYTFAFAQNQPTSSTFKIEAKAKGSQAADTSCKDLALDHTGKRDPSSCWAK